MQEKCVKYMVSPNELQWNKVTNLNKVSDYYTAPN
jgi:hypothetical protein